jgi:hypothetical protein
VRTWSHKQGAVNDSDEHLQDEPNSSSSKFRRLDLIPGFRQTRSPSVTPVYWPQDLVPLTIPSARVLTYGYDTHIRHWSGPSLNQNTIYDIAWDFLVSLEAERRNDPERSIIFVAHSLGGIVIKEMLRRSSKCNIGQPRQSHLYNMFTSTIGLMFFGTPHGGADPRSFIHHVAESVVKVMGWRVNNQIVNALLPSSERLEELRVEFGPIAQEQEWIIHSFQESLGVKVLSDRKVIIFYCLIVSRLIKSLGCHGSVILS